MILAAADPYAPDGDEAREWAEQELQNPRYAEAKPTWFDNLAQQVADFIQGLFTPATGGQFGGLALVIIVIVVVAAAITVLILWGRPRASRSVRRRNHDLLGERDARTAAQLRTEAERHAREADWDAATVLGFRAIARDLLERDVIAPMPGATAQAIARDAAATFVAYGAQLSEAASAFDDVRYLRHPATEAGYRRIAALDDALATTLPTDADRLVTL